MAEDKNRKQLKAYMNKTGESSNLICENIRQRSTSRIAPQTINSWLRKEKTITLKTWDAIENYITSEE